MSKAPPLLLDLSRPPAFPTAEGKASNAGNFARPVCLCIGKCKLIYIPLELARKMPTIRLPRSAGSL